MRQTVSQAIEMILLGHLLCHGFGRLHESGRLAHEVVQQILQDAAGFEIADFSVRYRARLSTQSSLTRPSALRMRMTRRWRGEIAASPGARSMSMNSFTCQRELLLAHAGFEFEWQHPHANEIGSVDAL